MQHEDSDFCNTFERTAKEPTMQTLFTDPDRFQITIEVVPPAGNDTGTVLE